MNCVLSILTNAIKMKYTGKLKNNGDGYVPQNWMFGDYAFTRMAR